MLKLILLINFYLTLDLNCFICFSSIVHKFSTFHSIFILEKTKKPTVFSVSISLFFLSHTYICILYITRFLSEQQYYIWFIYWTHFFVSHLFTWLAKCNIRPRMISIFTAFIWKVMILVEGDLKAPFSIATTPKCRGGCYSIPWITSLYSWSLPYNVEC